MIFTGHFQSCPESQPTSIILHLSILPCVQNEYFSIGAYIGIAKTSYHKYYILSTLNS